MITNSSNFSFNSNLPFNPHVNNLYAYGNYLYNQYLCGQRPGTEVNDLNFPSFRILSIEDPYTLEVKPMLNNAKLELDAFKRFEDNAKHLNISENQLVAQVIQSGRELAKEFSDIHHNIGYYQGKSITIYDQICETEKQIHTLSSCDNENHNIPSNITVDLVSSYRKLNSCKDSLRQNYCHLLNLYNKMEDIRSKLHNIRYCVDNILAYGGEIISYLLEKYGNDILKQNHSEYIVDVYDFLLKYIKIYEDKKAMREKNSKYTQFDGNVNHPNTNFICNYGDEKKHKSKSILKRIKSIRIRKS